MLTDPGTDSSEEDSATEYEEIFCTLNVYFVTKLNEPYERSVQKHDRLNRIERWLTSSSL